MVTTSYQYPQYLYALQHDGESVQLPNGSWKTPAAAWELKAACREETNGKGSTIQTADGQTLSVPSYRGLENPFGHVWSWTDGCKCNVQSDAAGGLSEFFVCTDPAKFQDIDYTDYEKRGEIPSNEGYVKIMMIGEYGENMPIEVGASSTTYFCDYYARGIPSSGSVTRGVLFGGAASYGASAGFSYANTTNSASNTYANIGSRLCFLPA